MPISHPAKAGVTKTIRPHRLQVQSLQLKQITKFRSAKLNKMFCPSFIILSSNPRAATAICCLLIQFLSSSELKALGKLIQ